MKKILALSVLIGITYAITSTDAFNLTFSSISEWDPIRNKFSTVSFTLPDISINSFQGGFFWLPTRQLPPWGINIQFTDSTATLHSKTCTKQVRGLYYTNAKGARLWPLDQQTLSWLVQLDASYANLSINGGLYTTCSPLYASGDQYSIYGHITYSQNIWGTWTWAGTLSAGFMYDHTQNRIDLSEWFHQTFQYFNNQTPLGYVYDDIGGIWFVWWVLPTAAHSGVLNLIKNDITRNINNIFWLWSNWLQLSGFGGVYDLSTWSNAWLDTLWNISVLWNVLLSRWWLTEEDRVSVLGNPNATSSVTFSDVISSEDILNELRKNANNLCRWQYKHNQWGDFTNIALGWEKVVCIYNDAWWTEFDVNEWSADDPVIINLSDPWDVASYHWKEIIVRGRNVVLRWSVPSNEHALNIFVDNGNILLANSTFSWWVADGSYSGNAFTVFEAQWEMLHKMTELKPIIDAIAIDTKEDAPVWVRPDWMYGLDQSTYQGSYVNYKLATTNNTSLLANDDLSASVVYDAMQDIGTWLRTKLNFGVLLRWNIFVNGLILGWGAWDVPAGISNKYYVHGRLASLNTALEPSAQRVQHINKLFGTNWADLSGYISFNRVFGWQCQLDGYAADADGNKTTQPCQVTDDVFKQNPLVLINTWVPTKLLP